MARSLCLLFFLLLVAVTAAVPSAFGGVVDGVSGAHHHHHALGWVPGKSACQGTIAECLGGEEFDLGSEISRRILATSRYISYNALRRDNVPCTRRGASYYNCRPGAQANPYSRGCSAITRCRS